MKATSLDVIGITRINSAGGPRYPSISALSVYKNVSIRGGGGRKILG